jgi:predicted lipoprotein
VAHALAIAVAFVGCDGGGPPIDTFAARKREILASLATGVILPTLRDFATSAAALELAAATHAADPSPENRAAAQAAWADTMAIWEEAEVMQLGPAGMAGTTSGVAGGLDLRDEIYAWPSLTTCRLDQETVEGAYADVDAFAAELVNVRGLGALEYLLFTESADNTCDSTSIINTDGSWAALGPDGVRERRAQYAHTLAALVARMAVQLRDAWEPTGGGFGDELAGAGDTSTVFATAQSALNDVASAMLYIDNQARDMKLGEPAGIVGCATATCLESLESPHANQDIAHIVANLRGFQRLFLGGAPGSDGLGLDDLLVDFGAEALAAQVREAIAAAIVAVEAIPGTLREAILAGAPEVPAAYEAMGLAQRLFKVDVVTVLDLEPLDGAPSDND